MSTPYAKRRRLNEASKTLHKPFKSPFRTPLNPRTDSSPPSSDLPDVETPLTAPTQSLSSEKTTISSQPAEAESQSTPLRPRPTLSTTSRPVPKKSSSKPSFAREIMQLRTEIQTLEQAHVLATSNKDDDLMVLIDRWRVASRAAAEEVFASTRDRVNRMGGVGAWREREREAKERQKKWDQEEMEAEKEKLREAMEENGEDGAERYEEYADIGGGETVEEEKDDFKAADDDSFTMGMMLKTLNIDLKLIGYNKDAQRWDG